MLLKLVNKHPIIPLILDYRSITKLKSTYVDAFPLLVNKRTRHIHTNYNQFTTATGRLSSTNPNLQNIPIRTELGREMRKAFVPRNDDYILLSADYSQIELRIIASLSKDENSCQAFKDGIDIHTATASKIFHIPLNEVTKDQRRYAKSVNFGIVYGISDFGLSQDLKISRKEAKLYIDNYLEKYAGIAKYMNNIVETAKENGYVETKFNRRRDLPELQSRNNNVRKFGERIALNMPIQGTAADIIKIAMINVYRALSEKGLKSKLILQVHDELIVEAPIDEVEIVKEMLVEKMQEATTLKVPLVVDVNVGDSWYETK